MIVNSVAPCNEGVNAGRGHGIYGGHSVAHQNNKGTQNGSDGHGNHHGYHGHQAYENNCNGQNAGFPQPCNNQPLWVVTPQFSTNIELSHHAQPHRQGPGDRRGSNGQRYWKSADRGRQHSYYMPHQPSGPINMVQQQPSTNRPLAGPPGIVPPHSRHPVPTVALNTTKTAIPPGRCVADYCDKQSIGENRKDVTSVWVTNIGRMTANDVEKMFQPFGQISKVWISQASVVGGDAFAYVEYEVHVQAVFRVIKLTSDQLC